MKFKFKMSKGRVWIGALVILTVFLPANVYALIDINTAVSAELETLKGIGPVIAGRIIEYRDTNGPFAAIEDIKNVKGIGDTIFSNIKGEITVGFGSGSSSSQNDTNDEENSSGSGSYISDESSAHSGTSSASPAKPAGSVSISAGRDRLTTVGNKVEFEAVYPANSAFTHTDFDWSFGDGGTAKGFRAHHIYYFPGVYAVVLNASDKKGISKATARATVTVVGADLQIASVDAGKIVIENKTNNEINIGGWLLSTYESKFIIPNDTIIRPRSSVSIPSVISKIRQSTGVGLINPLGQTAYSWGTGVNRREDIAELMREVGELSKTAKALVPKHASSANYNSQGTPLEPQYKGRALGVEIPEGRAQGLDGGNRVEGDKVEAVVYQAVEKKGFFSRITSFFKDIF